MRRTPEFEAFVAPAARYPALWRMVVAIVIGIAVYAFGAALVMFFGFPVLFDYEVNAELDFPRALERVTTLAVPAVEQGRTPQAMALLFLTFIPMALGAIVMAFWHWRGAASLFGPAHRFATYFAIASLVIALMNIGFLIVERLLGGPLGYVSNLQVADWMGYLIWAIPLLMIQITAEEMIFRGYLQQQLAARFQSFVWWMVLPSVIFGLAHYNPEADVALRWSTVVATGIVGLIAADLTRMTGSLAAAMGLHFANNFFAVFVIGVPGQLSGLALYHLPHTVAASETLAPLIWVEVVILLLVWVIIRRLIR